MNNINKCIILIHPSMSVSLTIETIKKHGFKVFTVVTGIEGDKINSKALQASSDFFYIGSAEIENDYSEIQQIIESQHLEVKAIINGIDSSLYYSDYLTKRLIKNTGIDLEYSNIRLNKYLVQQIMDKNNIHSIPSFEVTSADLNSNELAIINSLGWPLIAKPSENTASMAGYKMANNLEELTNHLRINIGQNNSYYSDCIVDKMIIQKYISIQDHDEFVIDFVSHEGKHYLQGIVIYDKEIHGKEIIYRTYRPLTLDEAPNIKPRIEYIENILNALKVNYGFTHNELFWDHQESAYFIESNNRMAGGGITDAYKRSYGYTPVESFIKLINNEEIESNYPLKRHGHSLCMHIYNFHKDNPSKINLEYLESFEFIVSFYPQNKTPMNFENYTRADHITATIVLYNKHKNLLKRDMDEIVKRENNGTLFI